jgi:hypothetical protein
MKTMPNTTVQAGRADRASWPGAQMRDQRGLLSRKSAVMTEFGFCDAE